MKKYFILAAAALAFAACSNKEDFTVEPLAEQEVGEVPVAFDSYVNRGVTRAGQTGEMKTGGNTPATGLKKSGFGVFGYYTDNADYDENTSTPNFMYNQLVEWNKTNQTWDYSPVKYWPNEYGENAKSDETDKLTFFAYAPYVDVIAATGKVTGDQTWGITGLTKNTAAGDPLVKYIVNFDVSKSVDLCWGTVPDDGATPDDQTSWSRTSGTNQTLATGKPWLDVERPADATGTQKMKFNFQHATSSLNVQIAYSSDVQVHTTTSQNIDEGTTKIFVRSIKFTGFATKGALNMNNTLPDKALWMSYNGVDDLESGESVTIYDGRKDGKEGVNGAVSTTEKITGLNTQIIQGDPDTSAPNYTARYKKGVTKDLQNLFTSATAEDPIFVIPTGETVTVEIVYDVETVDDKLAGFLSDGKTHGSTIENRIKKEIKFNTTETTFENGKAYVLKLYLGMNSVKFDASVSEWGTALTGDADLPANEN